MGIKPLHMPASKARRSGRIPIPLETKNKRTAMTSWVRRKKSGASVELSTHLLLKKS
jgi:hypothetical protein